MRLLLDENCSSTTLVALLRVNGHDVATTLETLESGTSDFVIADYAAYVERALITKDVGDFRRLYDQRMEHAGLMLIHEGPDGARLSASAIARAVDNVAAVYPSTVGLVLSLNAFIW